MDYVFIDTSIWENSNFLESKRIKEILRLAEEGRIQLLMPVITYHEIKNRANQNIKGAVDRYKKSRDETRILRNLDSLQNRFEPIEVEKINAEFQQLLEESFKKAKLTLLDYPSFNVKDVFEKYFSNAFPFSKGDKKHEFPDAFALLTIENWCAESKKDCIVITSDNDLANYESKYLTVYKGLEDYIDEILREIETEKKRQERLDSIGMLYEEVKGQLESQIEDWINEQLDDFTPYYSYFETDVHDIDVQEYEASLSGFRIVSIRDDSIQLEAEANISFKVEAEIDDEDTRWYDDEDKEYKYFETKTEVIEDEQVIPVSFKIDFPVADVEIPLEIEIDEINRGRSISLY